MNLNSGGVAFAMPPGSDRWRVARARSDSYIDILIELDPDAPIDLFRYAGIKRYVAELFVGQVDVVDRDALKPHLRRPADSDAVYAF